MVYNFLKLDEQYGKKEKTKGNTKLPKREMNVIVTEASKNKLSAAQIKAKLELPVGKRRVQQILHSNPNLKYKKAAKKPPLSQQHKDFRLTFAKEHMTWNKKWRNVVFSDEKKFNLD
jgi:hypothetical protein